MSVLASDRWLLPILAEHLDAEALASVERGDGGLWESAVGRGFLTDRRLAASVAARFHVSVADLSQVSRQALELVPERWARRYGVLPLAIADHSLLVATSNPCDLECERALAFAVGRDVRFAVAPPGAIARRLDEVYGDPEPHAPAKSERSAHSRVEVEVLSAEQESYESAVDDASDDAASVTRLVDELLGDGIAARASDIHVEPEEQGIVVRHRVDGVMRVARRLPRAVGASIVSRVKIISGLDIADRLRPQDGRARVAVNGAAVDLRISTLPASHGEKVVIRVLDARATVHTLDAIGFARDELDRIRRLLECREGLILVTGPTGSGKTTTLYAALRQLKQRAVNIVTVEDPIEYRLPGIVQVQVRERAGLTFAAALRSIMRQDPDVLLIGEIRDRETAEIAMQASLTGHLVLSTLHTNDAASAVTRLIDIGVAPYKIATAVKGILAQRLVRRLCVKCQAGRGSPSRGSGDGACRTCGGTGFHGRLAIVEVLIATAEFERRVAAGESAERIADAARRDGMRSLWLSGMVRVEAGETTDEEVRRVAAPEAALGESVDVGGGDDAGVVRYRPRRSTAGSLHFAESPPSSTVSPRLEIGTVDVYVIRPLQGGWRVLVLQRALDTRCPTAWEAVHGRIEPGEEPEEAAIREVREETGLEVARLYNVTVQPFYLHKMHTVQLAVVFAAFVDEPGDFVLGAEHQRAEWLPVDAALSRFQWPREQAALREITHLLRTGDGGAAEDVLRVQ